MFEFGNLLAFARLEPIYLCSSSFGGGPTRHTSTSATLNSSLWDRIGLPNVVLTWWAVCEVWGVVSSWSRAAWEVKSGS
jgi:hypothetical protein